MKEPKLREEWRKRFEECEFLRKQVQELEAINVSLTLEHTMRKAGEQSNIKLMLKVQEQAAEIKRTQRNYQLSEETNAELRGQVDNLSALWNVSHTERSEAMLQLTVEQAKVKLLTDALKELAMCAAHKPITLPEE
jgi:hypothetical protein